MKWKVLISAPYAMPVIDQYRRVLELENCEVIVADVNERLEEEEILALVGDVDGIICGDDRITCKVLASAPKLKVISKWGTGIDSIDLEAAVARNVKVCNTPNAFSEPVADTVFGYMLIFARQLPRMNADVHDGRWNKPQLFSLCEKTVGIIGVGNCGRAVVRRAVAFGMRVICNDIAEIPSSYVAATGVEVCTLPEVLRQADFVTIHTTLNPTSFHLMNEGTFALMRPSAYLINTSRGPVVHEEALVHALRHRSIAGAALDVFESEPLPENSELRAFDNCLLAPHNANSSPLAADRVHDNTIRNLTAELRRRGHG